ncbi:WD40-repeat-containing domain protein [Tuber indicum]|nr:WD40-repeat-containing domain protein [Tuber indicum]
MAKRKRSTPSTAAVASAAALSNPTTVVAGNSIVPPTPPALQHASESPHPPLNFQVITGSYDKVLHGFIVTIPSSSPTSSTPSTSLVPKENDAISLPATFTDSFLFTAHTAPIRTLTISPPSANVLQKRILATSSADEHINLYTLSSTLPPINFQKLKKAASTLTASNPKNKNLGVLSHHLNTPTAIIFTPNRSKIITAGLDAQIHILRTRDWAPLSMLKCPKPKPKPINYATDYGDGYGPRIDTFNSEATYGGGAGGVNDIALHPSQKILLSVGKSTRQVRMWNLMTGRKAGVLALSREVVPPIFGSEGTKVVWSKTGEEYAIAFERGVVAFGMDSKPKSRIRTAPISKVHQIRYINLPTTITQNKKDTEEEEVLTISTEDGRVLFYSTTDAESLDSPNLIGFLGGRSIGMPGRVKDFITIAVRNNFYLITGGTDGVVRIWDLGKDSEKDIQEMKKVRIDGGEGKQIGCLVGIYETERRITCLGVMEMGGEGIEEEEDVEMSDSSSSSSGGEDDDDDE